MPNLEKLSSDRQPPFRNEVDRPDFEQIEMARRQIYEFMSEVITEPKDRILGATLMQQIMVRDDFPNEVKMEAMKKGLELISGCGNDEYNKETAEVLIDSIRGCSSPDMRIRMASIISHDLQDQYIFNEPTKPTFHTLLDRIKRKESFVLIANDSQINPASRAWAKYLLEPRDTLKVFNELYDKDPNLDLLPRVREEETEINEGDVSTASVDIPGAGEYDIIRLNPDRIYTPKRRELYRNHFGHDPSLYVTRKTGARYVSVEFPSDLSNRIAIDVEEFRTNVITRNEVFLRADALWLEFLARMNEEQRAEFEELIDGNNLHIRFSTLRPRPNQENPEEGIGEERKAA